MNSWKNLLLLVILAGVGCWGLSVSIMRPDPPKTLPKGAPTTEMAPPTVDMGAPATAEIPGPGTAPTTAAPAAPVAIAPPGVEVPPPANFSNAAVPGPVSPGPPPPAPISSPPEAAPGMGAPPAAPPNTTPPLGAPAADKAGDRAQPGQRAVGSGECRVGQGALRRAHRLLSSLYGNPDVPPEMTRHINEMLDQMAGMVIYSRQHLLEKPYRVQQGDTLERIADSYGVTSTLLARINGIHDARDLRPDRDLKVVRGPFSAVISLERHDLALMLGDRYAGRFVIGIGREHPPVEGTYYVREKAPYHAPDCAVAGMNPMGKFWIDLGNQIGIHGTSDPSRLGRNDGYGSIFLSDRDIDDVYGILSIGSKVVIQR